MIVPLYEVPRYSRILVGDTAFEFDHIDGMYSYCTDDDGNIVHLYVATPVEIIREGPADGPR